MTGLDGRLEALAAAADLADGRLDEEAVAAARRVVEKAGSRLGLGVETTVAALAGPTGAGKSTLFNALARASLVAAGRRRPTTGVPTAAVWGDVDGALLDWLDVRRRHVVDGGEFDRLVLLDLPDFDSVEHAHREEVDRVVELADLVVWVVDPQKYADASWHAAYLRPLRSHAGAMAVALNQADLLDDAALAACTADLRALLEREGLGVVPVLAVAATTGAGVESLRHLLHDRVAARSAAVDRLAADVGAAVSLLAAANGEGSARGVQRADRDRVRDALADAAGVPTVVRAVASAHRRRGALAAGWPFVRWARRLRPDPLRRLRLGDRVTESVRTSLPGASPAQRARAETAARALAENASAGLPEPWPTHVRAAATAGGDELVDRLDRAVAGTALPTRPPLWWRAAGLLQTVAATAVAAGSLWLLALVGLGFLRLDDVVPLPEVGGIPAPTALLLAGALTGLAVAFAARVVNGFGARRRARAAERALRARTDLVAEELVLRPVEAELARHEDLLRALAAATGERRRRRLHV